MSTLLLAFEAASRGALWPEDLRYDSMVDPLSGDGAPPRLWFYADLAGFGRRRPVVVAVDSGSYAFQAFATTSTPREKPSL